jgi:aminopeptidase N
MYKCFLLGLMMSFGLYAQQDTVDFLTLEATIEPLAETKTVLGTVKVSFKILKATDSVFLDAKNFKILDAALESVAVSATSDNLWLTGKFQPLTTYTAFFSYLATPKQSLYFSYQQIWTQGQGKYTSHWLPSLDTMTDKIEFDLSILAPKEQMVVANGNLISVQETKGKNLWKFDMKHPMSSYLVALAIGDFNYRQIQTAGAIPLQLFYEPEDSLKVEPTYRYTKEIFDFLEMEIGVAYPWQVYKQVPIRDFLYAGMENTTCTFFSTAFVVDSIGFSDRNYVNVNAHELAHQWFGNFVTETEGKHHWLQEGFATYYALLAEKEVFGDDYFYWKLYNTAEQLKNLSDQGKGERLLDEKASSLTFYEKGAWALHILREKIGDDAFRKAIQNYLNKYAFQNVSTDDFLAEVRHETTMDITDWKENWLEQSAFQAEEAYQSLMQSNFIQSYFEIASLRSVAYADKKTQLEAAIRMNNDFISQEAIYQLAGEPFEEVGELYELALTTQNIFIRQAIALSLDPIPASFQIQYESLLEDASYLTQETALYNLWVNFPEKRKAYLDQLEGVVGFQNKNIRLLWLTLSLYTEEYLLPEKSDHSEELQDYTAPQYSFEIREKAFEYLYSMNLFTDKVLNNLVNACSHHYWRFRDAARKGLDEYLQDESHVQRMKELMMQMNEQDKMFLQRKYNWQ